MGSKQIRNGKKEKVKRQTREGKKKKGRYEERKRPKESTIPKKRV
jgi:hypothetical protein